MCIRDRHQGVFDRIASGVGGYAPLLLPTEYHILEHDGTYNTAPTIETQDGITHRKGVQERILNHVLWRRFMDAASIFLTLLFFSTFLLMGKSECDISFLEPVVPALARPVFEGWCSNPIWTLLLLLSSVWLWRRSNYVKNSATILAEYGWKYVREEGVPNFDSNHEYFTPGPFEQIALRLRNSSVAIKIYQITINNVLPCMFLLVLIALVALLAVTFFIMLVWFFSHVIP